MSAELGSSTWDIGRLSYEEDTQLEMPGKPGIFHHTDANTLARVG